MVSLFGEVYKDSTNDKYELGLLQSGAARITHLRTAFRIQIQASSEEPLRNYTNPTPKQSLLTQILKGANASGLCDDLNTIAQRSTSNSSPSLVLFRFFQPKIIWSPTFRVRISFKAGSSYPSPSSSRRVVI